MRVLRSNSAAPGVELKAGSSLGISTPTRTRRRGWVPTEAVGADAADVNAAGAKTAGADAAGAVVADVDMGAGETWDTVSAISLLLVFRKASRAVCWRDTGRPSADGMP